MRCRSLLLSYLMLILIVSLGLPMLVIGGAETSVVELDLVSSTMWGAAYDVTVSGDHAYCATKYGLIVLDISDPMVPVETGRLFIGEACIDVEVREGYAYLATEYLNMIVVDISDKAVPIILNRTQSNRTWSSGSVVKIVLDGQRAYISSRSSSLMVFDITDPINPVLLERQSIAAGCVDFDVVDAIFYAACSDQGLIMYDMTDPSEKKYLGRYDASADIIGVEYQAGYAYVIVEDVRIEQISITNPSNPVLMASFPTSYSPVDLQVEVTQLHVATKGAGYVGIDITDPQAPIYSYRVPTPDEMIYSSDVHYDNGYVYMLESTSGISGYYGLQILEVTDPSSSVLSGSYDIHRAVYDIKISGDYAFVANLHSGVKILDISDRSNPITISTIPTDRPVTRISLDGSKLLAKVDVGELTLFDVTDKYNPITLSHWNEWGAGHVGVEEIALKGDYVYTGTYYGNYDGMFAVFDISDPSTPILNRKLYGAVSIPERVFISGDFAYVADRHFGLKIIDISDPYYPALRSTFTNEIYKEGWYEPRTDSYSDVVVENGYAYLAAYPSGLSIVDVSDPDNPALVSIVPQGQYGWSGTALSKVGNQVWLASYYDGVKVVDVTDILQPSVIAYYETPGYATFIDADTQSGIVADGGGLILLAPPTNTNCCGLYSNGYSGNVNNSIDGIRDLADITRLIDLVYISKAPLDCHENGNVNGDEASLVDLADITRLIDHAYISKDKTAFCQ